MLQVITLSKDYYVEDNMSQSLRRVTPINMKVDNIAKLLVERDNFLIITHQHPDGDAFGSTLGLLNALLENGKKADAYFHEKLPINYQSIPQPEFITNNLLP